MKVWYVDNNIFVRFQKEKSFWIIYSAKLIFKQCPNFDSIYFEKFPQKIEGQTCGGKLNESVKCV